MSLHVNQSEQVTNAVDDHNENRTIDILQFLKKLKGIPNADF